MQTLAAYYLCRLDKLQSFAHQEEYVNSVPICVECASGWLHGRIRIHAITKTVFTTRWQHNVTKRSLLRASRRLKVEYPSRCVDTQHHLSADLDSQPRPKVRVLPAIITRWHRRWFV